jgi:hypothetical protein
MGFDAEWQLAACMRSGARGSGYPEGWLSEKKPCPQCGKMVAGRHSGMAEHIAAKHSMKRTAAMRYVLSLGLSYRDSDAMLGTKPEGLSPEGVAARAEGIAQPHFPEENQRPAIQELPRRGAMTWKPDERAATSFAN